MCTPNNDSYNQVRSPRDNGIISSRPRRATFQQMLKVEKTHKVNRMQTSTTVITVEALNITQACNDSQQPFQRPPVTILTTKRTMTAPALSLSIPETQGSKDDRPAKYIIKNGKVSPHNEVRGEEESVRSSICHSPSWDDATARQRKKEKQEIEKKLKMEKKKQETEAKHAHKMKNRLTKRPPTSDRLSKMGVSPDRAISTPTTLILPETKEESKTPSVHSRSRRSSFDLGIRSLLSWKSSSHASSIETSPTKGISPSNESGGFVGGLKLRLSEEATAQERMRTSSSVPDDQHAIPTKQDKTPNASKATSITGTLPKQSPRQATMRTQPSAHEDLVPKLPQWDVINGLSGDTARAAIGPQPAAEHVPIIKINVKRGQKIRAPVINDSSTDSSSRSGVFSQIDSSSSSKVRDFEISRQTASENSYSQGQKPKDTPDNRNGVVHGSDISMHRSDPTNLCTSSNYVQSQRRQSQDVSLVAFEDQYRAGRANHLDIPPRWSPESFHTVRSHMSIETAIAPQDEIVGALPFFEDDYNLPQLSLELSPTSSIAESYESKSSKGIKRLKDAARAAISRHSGPGSDDSINPDIAKVLSAPRQFPLTRTAAKVARENIAGQASESEKLFGKALNRRTHLPPSSNISTPSSRPPIPSGSSNRGSSQATARNEGHDTRASRGPSTDSSEDHSTYDESSNDTTPTPSTPTSQKTDPLESRSGMNGYGSRDSSTGTLSRKGKNSAVMSGPITQERNRSRDNSNRNTMPNPLADDEERLKKPKASEKSAGPTRPSGKTSQVSKAEIDAGLNRKPSVSRSTSTLDLSFLPALKHEALMRSPHAKQRRVGTGFSQPALIRSPPSTEFEVSSSTLRLHSHPPPINQQPIAKMLVKCCSCHYFHDMPSKIYSCMASPASVVEDKDRGVHGLVTTSVKCPWCGHGMSTACCAGWAAVIYLREKLH